MSSESTAFRRPTPTREQIVHAAYQFGQDHLSEPIIRSLGGTPNATFEFRGGRDGALAIRFCNTFYTSTPHLQAQVQVLEALSSLKPSQLALTPTLVHSREGAYLIRVDGIPVLATQYVEGTRLDRCKPSPALNEKVGRSVGWLAAHLRQLEPSLPESETFRRRSQRLMDQLAHSLARERWTINPSVVESAWLQYCREEPSHGPVLAHTDVWPQNLILTSTGAVVVLDFDDMAYGPLALDLASAVSEFAVDGPGRINSDLLQALLRGFAVNDLDGLNKIDGQSIVTTIMGLYASWIACDVAHGQDPGDAYRYYTALQKLTSRAQRLEAADVINHCIADALRV